MKGSPGNPVLEGARILLRVLRPEDVGPDYVGWMNDARVTAFLESRFTSQDLEGIRRFVASLVNDRSNLLLGIFLKDTPRHIGNIKLGNIDRNHLSADIGILIGEVDCWNKGYASEAVALLSEYAFSELGLHKLTAGFYAENQGSIKAFAKAGFQEEGRCKEQYALGNGKRTDGILLGKLRPEAGK